MIEKLALSTKLALGKYQFDVFGREAANAYLERNVSLNETIEKIANENDLTYNQIERVCEAANKDVYLHLFKNQSNAEKTGAKGVYEKYVVFPIAEPGVISKALNKTASVFSDTSDYYADVPSDLVDSGDPLTMFAVESSEVEKTASPNSDLGYDIIAKLKSVQQQLAGSLLVKQAEIDETRQRLYSAVKTALLNEEFSFAQLCKLASKHFKSPKVADVLKDTLEGLEKYEPAMYFKIASSVDEGLISDKLDELAADTGVQVLNGRHPVWMEINTLVPQIEDYAKVEGKLWILNDRLRYVKNTVLNQEV
jgi:hypothetical protein